MPAIVGEDKPLTLALQVEAPLGEPFMQLAPRAGLLEDGPSDRPGIVEKRRLAGTLELADDRGGQAVRILDMRCLAQAERQFLAPQRSHEPGAVLPAVPGSKGLRVDAVDQEMDVLVGGVPMGDDESLMSFEAQVSQGGVDDLLPLLAGEVLIRGERDREMLDGLVSASLGCGDAHEDGRLLGVLQG